LKEEKTICKLNTFRMNYCCSYNYKQTSCLKGQKLPFRSKTVVD
jgi:hypothetical protein